MAEEEDGRAMWTRFGEEASKDFGAFLKAWMAARGPSDANGDRRISEKDVLTTNGECQAAARLFAAQWSPGLSKLYRLHADLDYLMQAYNHTLDSAKFVTEVRALLEASRP